MAMNISGLIIGWL